MQINVGKYKITRTSGSGSVIESDNLL